MKPTNHRPVSPNKTERISAQNQRSTGLLRATIEWLELRSHVSGGLTRKGRLAGPLGIVPIQE
jgi:hypothetical protein